MLLPILLLPLFSSGALAATWYQPPAGTSFLYSINEETIPPNPKSSSKLDLRKAAVYDVDLFTTSAETIAGYKSQGKKVICYFSAGSYESYRPDVKEFNQACLCNQGKECALDGWDGEWWLNIHTATCKTNVKKVMAARIKLAKTKGCDGVDPDNVDSYTNKNGAGNTEADQLAYDLWLASTAHSNGLSVGLKNAGDLLQAHTKEMVAAFDFSVVEQCEEYNECDVYSPFVKANKMTIDIEYTKAPKNKKGWFSMKYSQNSLSYKYMTATAPKY